MALRIVFGILATLFFVTAVVSRNGFLKCQKPASQ